MIGVMNRFSIFLIALAAFGSPALAQQGSGRGAAPTVRCLGCDSASVAAAMRREQDSQISALTIELARNREQLAQLEARLGSTSSDSRARRQLEERIAALGKEMERLEWQLSVRCGEEPPVRGYIGVHVTVEKGGPGRVVRTFPVVQMVEPGSPAARAGLAADDTIITVNRADARASALERFVREPGDRVIFSVASESGRREVTLTVAPKPPAFGGSCMQFRTMQVAPRPAGRAATYIMLPTTAGGTPVFTLRGGSVAIIAGAEIALITEGLKAAFSVEHGALVLNVTPRSPAEEAGVLSGDVIVRAQGEAVTSLSVLQKAIHAAAERRSVSLDVVRARQPKTITLRW
jgi:C-terminal processing protease CtpA/Prc